MTEEGKRRRVQHLIKMWLEGPVEETDELLRNPLFWGIILVFLALIIFAAA